MNKLVFVIVFYCIGSIISWMGYIFLFSNVIYIRNLFSISITLFIIGIFLIYFSFTYCKKVSYCEREKIKDENSRCIYCLVIFLIFYFIFFIFPFVYIYSLIKLINIAKIKPSLTVQDKTSAEINHPIKLVYNQPRTTSNEGSSAIICSKCGTPLEPDAFFCVRCGNQIG